MIMSSEGFLDKKTRIQRALNSVTDNLFNEASPSAWFAASVLCNSDGRCVVKPAVVGKGIEIVSLPSHWITKLMVGLFATFCWTHNKPMWMNLMISFVWFLLKTGWMILAASPATQHFHAYKHYHHKLFYQLNVEILILWLLLLHAYMCREPHGFEVVLVTLTGYHLQKHNPETVNVCFNWNPSVPNVFRSHITTAI